MTSIKNAANAVVFSFLLTLENIVTNSDILRPISDDENMLSPHKMQRFFKKELLAILESTDSPEDQGKAIADLGLYFGAPHNGKLELLAEWEFAFWEFQKELEKATKLTGEIILQSLCNSMLAVMASFPAEYSEALEWADVYTVQNLTPPKPAVIEPAVEEKIATGEAVAVTPEMNSEFENISTETEETAPEGTDVEGDDAVTEDDEIPGTEDATEGETETVTEAQPVIIAETVAKPTTEPAAEPATEPIVETAPETTPEVVTEPVVVAAIEPTVEVISETVKVIDASVMKGGIEFVETTTSATVSTPEPAAVAAAKELIHSSFSSFKSLADAKVLINPTEPPSLPLNYINTPILTIPRQDLNVEILTEERLEIVLGRIEKEKINSNKPFDAAAETARLMSRKPGLQIGIVLTNIDGQDYKLGCSPKNFEPGFCWPQIDIIDSNKNVLTVPALLNFTATSYKGEFEEKATLSGIGEVDGDVCVGYIPVVIEESRQTTASVIKMLKLGYEFVATARATTRDGKYYNFWKAPAAKTVELKFQNPTPHYVKGVVGNLPI